MKKICNSNFNRFIIANIISKFGDSLDLIAFMWMTQEITNSSLLTGIVLGVNGLPALILGLFSGVIADIFPKKKILIICDFLRGATVTLVVVLYILKVLNFPMLIVTTFINSTLEILSAPARRSMPPLILEKDKLLAGNSMLRTGKLVARLIGLSLAGVIINYFGIIVAVGIDAVTFFLSFTLIKLIDYQDVRVETNIKKSLKLDFIIKDVKKAFIILVREKIILKTTLVATITNLFIGPFNLIILTYCKDILKNDSNGHSILNTVNIVGFLVINALFMRKLIKVSYEKLIAYGFFLFSITYIILGINQSMIGAIIIIFIYGVATALVSIPSVTLIQRNTPKEHLGKMLSIIALINESSIPLGNLMFGILIANYSIGKILLISGIVMAIFFCIAYGSVILVKSFDKKNEEAI